jgi:hypothetical protein
MSYVGFVYKWNNIENNMFYVGSHRGNIYDGYIGSGTLFREVYFNNKKLFKRDILEYVYDEKDLLDKEQYYLDFFDVKNNDLSYNLNPKTSGGWNFCHENEYLVDKRNKSIRDGFERGRIIYNKGKKIENLYDEDIVLKIKDTAKKTIGSIYNRNKGDRGEGLNNSNSKVVSIEYLYGNLNIICEGTFRKWCHSGSYKKDNKNIWKITYIKKEDYNKNDYLDFIKYDGEKYTKDFLLNITENKMILNVHNRTYYLCTHIKTNCKIVTDVKKTELRLKLKGSTGKNIWNIEVISYDDFKKLKNKTKYYDGKIKLCEQTIREYCSVL